MLINPTPNSDIQFGEAPASWNTRYVTPDGFECQLTIRGENGTDVAEKSSACFIQAYVDRLRQSPKQEEAHKGQNQ